MPDRRIIAIAVSPRAYDEILKLKGKVTWTDFTLRAVNALVGSNTILEEEIANLPKPKPKAEKPKPKKERKAKDEKTEPETKKGT
jgi:hypothetical protein